MDGNAHTLNSKSRDLDRNRSDFDGFGWVPVHRIADNRRGNGRHKRQLRVFYVSDLRTALVKNHVGSAMKKPAQQVEWPTLFLVAGCFMVWGLATTLVATYSIIAGVILAALAIALFSSLQHEVIHGHPFKWARINEALVFPSLPLFIPYLRFRDTHLDHHVNADLTDPYDDPESNYLDPQVWAKLPNSVQKLLCFNNTLLGRVLIGSAVSQVVFMRGDLRLIRNGDRQVLVGCLWHIPSVALVFAWLIWVGAMPIWAYLVAAYMGLSLVKIRTFLEHQAHERAAGRTAIVEDQGFLAFLFLNNNLHVVHHAHPRVPWYRLPALYWANKDRYGARNGGYVFQSYGQVFRQFLLQRKDPVPHPLRK